MRNSLDFSLLAKEPRRRVHPVARLPPFGRTGAMRSALAERDRRGIDIERPGSPEIPARSHPDGRARAEHPTPPRRADPPNRKEALRNDKAQSPDRTEARDGPPTTDRAKGTTPPDRPGAPGGRMLPARSMHRDAPEPNSRRMSRPTIRPLLRRPTRAAFPPMQSKGPPKPPNRTRPARTRSPMIKPPKTSRQPSRRMARCRPCLRARRRRSRAEHRPT